MKTLIIAEAGVNHNGDMDAAFKLIDAAAYARADVVKFQTFSADRLVVADAKKADYQMQATNAEESQHAMLRRLELTPEMHEELIAHCKLRDIEFLSTGFDEESVDLLAALDLSRFKIPSGELTNLPYLRHIGAYGKPIILSTGMATLDEVTAAVRVLETAGTPRTRITLLHCNTGYPTPVEDVNLRAMLTLKKMLEVATGYSDHTLGMEVAIAAVALGATVIEKHFTLDRSLPGPDHQASLEPNELQKMIVSIRNIEQAMGDGVKRPSSSESSNLRVVRRSLVAARPITGGEILDETNIVAKRPGTGLSPMCWDEVIGTRAIRDFALDEMIER